MHCSFPCGVWVPLCTMLQDKVSWNCPCKPRPREFPCPTQGSPLPTLSVTNSSMPNLISKGSKICRPSPQPTVGSCFFFFLKVIKNLKVATAEYQRVWASVFTNIVCQELGLHQGAQGGRQKMLDQVVELGPWASGKRRTWVQE